MRLAWEGRVAEVPGFAPGTRPSRRLCPIYAVTSSAIKRNLHSSVKTSLFQMYSQDVTKKECKFYKTERQNILGLPQLVDLAWAMPGVDVPYA